jgi:hypothetical protein
MNHKCMEMESYLNATPPVIVKRPLLPVDQRHNEWGEVGTTIQEPRPSLVA